jgi:DNA-binding GntR family transcriptional regulator
MDLCAEFDVSLAVVREALSRLAAEGLVVADPQKSFCVAPVSLDDLRDLTWVRIELEGLALREAIARGDVDWESRIVAAFHGLSRTPLFADIAARTKNEAWARAHGDFHLTLIDACGSAWLLRLREALFSRSERYRRLSALVEGPDRDIEAEHRALMAATLARDAARATEVLRDHLLTTADLVRAMFLAPGDGER